jgi:hypothetical protein
MGAVRSTAPFLKRSSLQPAREQGRPRTVWAGAGVAPCTAVAGRDTTDENEVH